MAHNEPMQDSSPSGRVEIAESVIIGIIHETVLSCHGVVDMGPRSLGSVIVKRLGIGNGPHRISIENEDGHLIIELSVVIEYGTLVSTVAQNVMQTVKFQLECMLGMSVDRVNVNVNVDGLRVSSPSGSSV